MRNGGILPVVNSFCVTRHTETLSVVGKVTGGKKKRENNQDVLDVLEVFSHKKKKEKRGLDRDIRTCKINIGLLVENEYKSTKFK